MKVIFVTATGGFGGPTRSLHTLLRHLPGIQRCLVSPSNGSFAQTVQSEACADELFMAPRRGVQDRRYQARSMQLIHRAIGKQRPAVVHANGLAELFVAAIPAALRRVPIVVWCHANAMSANRARAFRIAMRIADVTPVAVSPVAAAALRPAGIDPETVAIIPNPIDPEIVLAPPRTTGDPLRVAYVSPPIHAKGFDTFADLAASVEKDDHFSFVAYVPPNRMDDADVVLAAQAGVEARPWHADVREVYRDIDVLVCPSRAESFSRLAAEAMANGMPVLASDIPAHKDTLAVGEESAALFFPRGDVAAARGSLLQLRDSTLQNRLAELGRIRAADFAPDTVAESFRQLYERVAGSDR